MTHEQKILGTILVDGAEALEEVLSLVRPDMLNGQERELFELFIEMAKNNEPIETSTVFLKKKFDLKFLTNLSDQLTSSAKLPYHARKVYENHLRTTLIAKADRIKRLCSEEKDTFDLIMKAQKEIAEIDIEGDEDKPMNRELDDILDSIERRIDNKNDDVLTFRTLPTMNKIIGGIMPTDLIGIYGKEKSTKTTLAYEMMLDLSVDQKIPTAVFSFEMEKELVYWKCISMRTGLDLNKLRNPQGYDERSKLSKDEFKKIKGEIYDTFKHSKIIVNDEILDELQIQSKIKQWKKKYGIRLVIIDYLMLMNASEKFSSLREELNYLSKFFKRLAKKLGVAIVLVSQANDEGSRAAEGKGLERDANYFFYVQKLEKGSTIEQYDAQTDSVFSYKSDGDDFLVINRGIRHGKGNRSFVTKFIDNKYKEVTVKYE